VRLTGKEAAVLKYLYRARGPATRVELLQQVWGYNATATTHTVETHIYRLRQKLEPDPSGMRMLLNESGGYRLYPSGISVSNGAAEPMPFDPAKLGQSCRGSAPVSGSPVGVSKEGQGSALDPAGVGGPLHPVT